MVLAPVEIDIRTKVTGLAEVKALETALSKLQQKARGITDVQERVTAKTKLDTEIMKQNNRVLLAKTEMTKDVRRALAKQQVIQEDLTKTFSHQMNVERRAFRINQANIKEGMKSNIVSARVAAETAIQEEAAYKKSEIALKAKRRALMQVSISMFVFNISVGQMVSSLLPLVKGSEEATKALKGYQAILMLSMGPMQAYMAIKMIQINLERQHQAAVFGVVAAMSAAYFWYAMLTTKSKEMKIILGALAGVMTALAARQAFVAITAWQAAVAQATGRAVIGDVSGWVKIGVGLGIAAGVGATIGGLLPTGQTRVGQRKRVGRGGLAELHEGEEISRPRMGTRGIGEGGGDTIIYLPESYRGTVSQSRFFAEEVNRLLKSGQGTVKMKRVVVS